MRPWQGPSRLTKTPAGLELSSLDGASPNEMLMPIDVLRVCGRKDSLLTLWHDTSLSHAQLVQVESGEVLRFEAA